ncbi:complement factor H-like isoform X2 [Ambystoma mexicanum]|uniref:complement factor H-like isoform X2 n=1 Tax=Ambystoma mexicanum TaxID=8296 RepID=UPI0037E92623
MNSLVCCVFLMLWACGRAEGVACNFPEIENGRVSRWSYYTFKDQHFPMAKGRQIEYDCYEGFSTESGSREDLITCTEDGWSPKPKCIRPCAILTPAVKSYEPMKVFTSKDNVHYECEDGYKSPQNNLVDKAECTPTGWKPEQKCTEITCSLPNNIQHLRFISSETFKNGHVVKFNCEEGYTLIGANKIECYYFGWYPEPPRCEGSEEECPLPPVLANTIEEEMKPPYHSGDTVSYNCKLSYRLHGSKSITCVNGRWTSPPQCIEKEVCPRPPETPNGRILLTAHKAPFHGDDTVFHSDDIVVYACDTGYRINGASDIKCRLGRWPAAPACTEKEVCPRPPETPNGRILLPAHKALYHSDDIVVYACDRGYRINGPSDIKCWLGRWPAAPACTAIACGAAPPVQDAAIVGPQKERYTSGERVTYKCQQGYAFENQSYVTCLDGQWRDPPVCKEKEICPQPPETRNGRILQTLHTITYHSDDIVVYACDTGYRINGPSDIKCWLGRWPAAPACIAIACGAAPPVQHAAIVGPQKERYTSGERVTYKCQQGYTFENQSHVTCLDGQWTDPPVCEATACSAAPQVENADIVGQAKGIYTSGERVTYECHQGYAFEKHSHVTCLDSEWTEAPVCERGRCGPAPTILNGDVIGTREQSYNSGGFVDYKCAASHKMFGSSRVRCLNGDWSAIPECLGPCQVESDKLEEHNVELDIREGEKVSFLEGETIRFTCIDGFRAPTPVSLFVRCTAAGFKYPTCTDPHPCRILQEDMDGNNLELETKADKVLYRNGEFIQFSCKAGFFETGPLSGICIESKISFPTCIPPKGCPLLQERLDSFNIQLSHRYADKRYLVNGESVQFLCNHGFKIHRSSSSMLQECDNGIIVYPKCVKFILVSQKEDK